MTILTQVNVIVLGGGFGGLTVPRVLADAALEIQLARDAACNIRRALTSQLFRHRDCCTLATVEWEGWLFVHIWNFVGFRNWIVVMTQWAWSHLTYQRSVCLIVDPDE